MDLKIQQRGFMITYKYEISLDVGYQGKSQFPWWFWRIGWNFLQKHPSQKSLLKYMIVILHTFSTWTFGNFHQRHTEWARVKEHSYHKISLPNIESGTCSSFPTGILTFNLVEMLDLILQAWWSVCNNHINCSTFSVDRCTSNRPQSKERIKEEAVEFWKDWKFPSHD